MIYGRYDGGISEAHKSTLTANFGYQAVSLLFVPFTTTMISNFAPGDTSGHLHQDLEQILQKLKRSFLSVPEDFEGFLHDSKTKGSENGNYFYDIKLRSVTIVSNFMTR